MYAQLLRETADCDVTVHQHHWSCKVDFKLALFSSDFDSLVRFNKLKRVGVGGGGEDGGGGGRCDTRER